MIPAKDAEALGAFSAESQHAGTGQTGDEYHSMSRRLVKSDELIKQLKHIVKAQHGKIEELRERLESEPAGTVRSQMAAHDQKDLKRVKEDNDELRRHVHRVKAENDRLKSESDTMRKANS